MSYKTALYVMLVIGCTRQREKTPETLKNINFKEPFFLIYVWMPALAGASSHKVKSYNYTRLLLKTTQNLRAAKDADFPHNGNVLLISLRFSVSGKYFKWLWLWVMQ